MADIPNLSESTSSETVSAQPNIPSRSKSNVLSLIISVLLIFVVIGLGIFTGFYFGGKTQNKNTSGETTGIVSQGEIVKGKEFGSNDLKKFKDTAVGVLEKNGLDGEGTHKLIRDGGPSQTVYLTSSVLDLDQFVGRKLQVWGETFQAQKAGWFMDVGRVKVIE